jgi:hypothetical protein
MLTDLLLKIVSYQHLYVKGINDQLRMCKGSKGSTNLVQAEVCHGPN